MQLTPPLSAKPLSGRSASGGGAGPVGGGPHRAEPGGVPPGGERLGPVLPDPVQLVGQPQCAGGAVQVEYSPQANSTPPPGRAGRLLLVPFLALILCRRSPVPEPPLCTARPQGLVTSSLVQTIDGQEAPLPLNSYQALPLSFPLFSQNWS